jgi:hypothetical protein
MKDIVQRTVRRVAGDQKAAVVAACLLTVAFLGLASLARRAHAENPQQANPLALAGTWKADLPGLPSWSEYETFTADGGSIEINNGRAANAVAIGTWTRTGPDQFLSTIYKQIWVITNNDAGDYVYKFDGTVKVRRQITLNPNGNELIGAFKVEVFDENNNLEFEDVPGTYHGTRIVAEPITQPVMLSPTVSGSDITVYFTGRPGVTHGLQRASPDGNWEDVADVVVPTNGVANFTDPMPPRPGGFYRAVAP